MISSSSVAADFRQEIDGRLRYTIPAEMASTIAYSPRRQLDSRPKRSQSTSQVWWPAPCFNGTSKSQQFERIATSLSTAEQVLEILHAHSRCRRPRPRPVTPFVAPRNQSRG